MDGPGSGTTFNLQEHNHIGSNQSRCNIYIPSQQINDTIAIKKHGTSYLIQSCKTITVLVNGQPVIKSRKLIHGDMITIADVMLLYGEESANPSIISPPPQTHESHIINVQKASDLQDLLLAIKNTPNAVKYEKIMEQVDEVLRYHLQCYPIDKAQALQDVLEVLISNNFGQRGLILLKEKDSDKLWPVASVSKN